VKFILKKEFIFVFLLLLPIALFAIGNLLGLNSIRELSAFSAVPILLIFALAFLANLLQVSASKNDGGKWRQRCEEVLNTLQSAPNLILAVEPSAGSKFTVRFTNGGFLLTNADLVTTPTLEELLSILADPTARLSLTAES
jgi:hypothetical protein